MNLQNNKKFRFLLVAIMAVIICCMTYSIICLFTIDDSNNFETNQIVNTCNEESENNLEVSPINAEESTTPYGRASLVKSYGEESSAVELYDELYTVIDEFHKSTKDASLVSAILFRVPKAIDVTAVLNEFGEGDGNNGQKIVASVLRLVQLDNPEFYWINKNQSYPSTIGNGTTAFYIQVINEYRLYSNRKQINQSIERKFADYESLINDNMTEYEKVYAIYSKLIADVSKGAEGTSLNEQYNIVGAFAKGFKILSEGYAKSFKYLLDKFNIESIIVNGTTSIYSTGSQYWNMVKIDGEWYNFDVMLCDANNDKSFYCVPNCNLFNKTHTVISNVLGTNYLYELPTASSFEHAENSSVESIGSQIVSDNLTFEVVSPRTLSLISIAENISNISLFSTYKIETDLCCYVVSNIADNAFKDNTSITTLDISATQFLTSIGASAFEGAKNLTNVSLSNSTTKLGDKAFKNTGLTGNFDLSTTSIEKLGKEVFYGTNIEKIVLPNTITNLTTNTFLGVDNLKIVNVDEGGKLYASIDGILVNGAKNRIIYYPIAKDDVEYSLPSTINSIGDYAFANNQYLSKVILNSSISSIGEGAFYNCKNLATINIENKIFDIPNYAFYGTKIKSLDFHKDIKSIGNYAFANSSLTNVTFSGNAPKISLSAFDGCSKLSMIVDGNYRESWWSAYNTNECTWQGVKTYFTYIEPTYSKGVYSTQFDTEDYTGQMTYSSKLNSWQAGSTKTTSLITTEKYVLGTSFDFTIKTTSNATHRGLIFFANEGGSEYCYLAITATGTLRLSTTGNETLCEVSINGYSSANNYYIKVVAKNNGEVFGYAGTTLDNLIQYVYAKVQIKESNCYYLLNTGKNTTFSEPQLLTYGDNSVAFTAISGCLTDSNNKITFADNTLAVVSGKEYDGTSKYTASADVIKENAGLVFAYDEDLNTYYSLYIADGKIKLDFNNNGTIENKYSSFIKNYVLGNKYNIKVVRDELSIEIYVNNVLVSTYTESTRLAGTSYGIFGGANNVMSSLIFSFKNDYSRLDDETQMNRQGIYFTLNDDGTAYVGDLLNASENSSKYSGANYGSVIIPDNVKTSARTYKVVGIAPYAFKNNISVKNVQLPNTITDIRTEAFYGCSNLTIATFKGDAPSKVGNNIFDSTHPYFRIECSIESENWKISYSNPKWNNYVAIYTEDSYYLDYIILDSDLTDTQGIIYSVKGNEATVYDNNYCGTENAIIPEIVVYQNKFYTVTAIDNNAFENLKSIKTISLPNTLKTIGSFAFTNCTNLVEITLPAKITEINNQAFSKCTNLVSVNSNGKISRIYQKAFYNCTSLVNIDLSNITYLGADAFSYCSSLLNADLSRLASIPNNAFLYCDSLKTVTFSKNLQTIYAKAFYNCSSLEKLVNIENSKLVTIENNAFYNCSTLKEVTLPSTLETICYSAFSGANNLKTVTFIGNKPVIQKEAFGKNNGDIVLYYNLDTVGWSSPYIASENNDYYMAMFIGDTYSGKDGVVLKYATLKFNDLWISANGVHKYANGLQQDSSAIISNCEAERREYSVFEADITGNTTATSKYGVLFAINLNGEEKFSFAKSNAYFLGITPDGLLNLSKIQNNSIITLCQEEIAIPSYDTTKTYNIRAQYNGATGEIKCYLNNVLFMTYIDTKKLDNGSFGFVASGIGMHYENVAVTLLGSVLEFDDVTGEIDDSYEDVLKFKEEGFSLISNYTYDKQSMFNFSTDIKYTGTLKRNGIVFAYSENSYYLLAVESSANGNRIALYKVINGESELLVPKVMDVFNEDTLYNIKVVWSADSDIDCYINGEWCFTCKEDSALEGSSYGIYSESTNVEFSNTIVVINSTNGSAINDYSYLDGNYKNIQGISFTLNDADNTACVNSNQVYDKSKDTSISAGYIYIPQTVVFDEIEYAVISVEKEAFIDNYDIEFISLPDSILEIKEGAFKNCKKLTGINMPTKITKISDYLFCNCYNLESITLSDSITEIGQLAFYGCIRLEELTLPKSLETIGFIAFGGVQVREFIVENNENFIAVDGVLYTSDMATLVWYPALKLNETFTVPDTVTTIGAGAFACATNITELIIPLTVTTIKSRAFSGMENLKSISELNITVLEDYTFRDCTSLKFVSAPYLISIGNGAFESCALESFTIAETVTTIGDYAFNYTNLTSIVIPDNVTTVGAYPFDNIDTLEIAKIGKCNIPLDSTFNFGCQNLQNIIIDSENEYYYTDSYGVIYNADKTILYFMPRNIDIQYYSVLDTCTSLKSHAIAYNNNLVNVYLPYSVENIDSWNFNNCSCVVIVSNPYFTSSAEFSDYVLLSELTPIDLEIYKPSNHIEFTIGNYPDFSGLEIAINYSYLSTYNYKILVNNYYFEDFDYNTFGEKEITVCYETNKGILKNSFFVYFNEVKTATSLSLELPSKLEYLLGEDIELNDLVVNVCYDNNDIEVTNDYVVEGYNKNISGVQTISVIYTTNYGQKLVATFEITVIGKSVSDLIVNAPNKTDYTYGEDFDSDGISAMLVYNTGEVEPLIYGIDYIVEDYDKERIGRYDVHVKFLTKNVGELSWSFTVIVTQIHLDEVLDKPSVPMVVVTTKNTIAVCSPDADKNSAKYNKYFTYSFQISEDGLTWSEWTNNVDSRGYCYFNELTAGKEYYFRLKIDLSDGLDISIENEYAFYSDTTICSTLKETNLYIPNKPTVTSKDGGVNDLVIVTITPNIDDPIYNAGGEEMTYEYSINGGKTWRSSNIFTKIEAKTDILACIRFASTEKFDASSISQLVEHTTCKCSRAPSHLTVENVTSTSLDLLNCGIYSMYRMDKISITKDTQTGEDIITVLESYDWQFDRKYTGLTPNTTYRFQMKYLDSDKYYASEFSDYTIVTTAKINAESPTENAVFFIEQGATTVKFYLDGENLEATVKLVKIVDDIETLVDIDGMETYSRDENGYVNISGLSPVTTYAILFRYKESVEYLASDWFSDYATFTTTKLTHENIEDYPQVVSVSTNYINLEEYIPAISSYKVEYSCDGGLTWQSSSSFYGLTHDTTYIIAMRYAEDATHYAYDGKFNTISVKTKIDFCKHFDINENGIIADDEVKLVGDKKFNGTVYVDIPYNESIEVAWYVGEELKAKSQGNYSYTITWQDMYDIGINTGDTLRAVVSSTNNGEFSSGSFEFSFVPEKLDAITKPNANTVSKGMYGTEFVNIYFFAEKLIFNYEDDTVYETYYDAMFRLEGFDNNNWSTYTYSYSDSGQIDKHYYDANQIGKTYTVEIKYAENYWYKESQSISVDFTVKKQEVSESINIVDKKVTGDFVYGGTAYLEYSKILYGDKDITDKVIITWSIVERYKQEDVNDASNWYYSYRITSANSNLGNGRTFTISKLLDYYDESANKTETIKYSGSHKEVQYDEQGRPKTITVDTEKEYLLTYLGYVLEVRVKYYDDDGNLLSSDTLFAGNDNWSSYTPENIIKKAIVETPDAPVVDETKTTSGGFYVKPIEKSYYIYNDVYYLNPQFVIDKTLVRITENGFEYSFDSGVNWILDSENTSNIKVNGVNRTIKLVDGLIKYFDGNDYIIADSFSFFMNGETHYIYQNLFDVEYSVNDSEYMTYSELVKYASGTLCSNATTYTIKSRLIMPIDAFTTTTAIADVTITTLKIDVDLSTTGKNSIDKLIKNNLEIGESTAKLNNTDKIKVSDADVTVYAMNMLAETDIENLKILYSIDGETYNSTLSLTSLKPNTEYTIYYKLFGTTLINDCNKEYSITFTTLKEQIKEVPAPCKIKSFSEDQIVINVSISGVEYMLTDYEGNNIYEVVDEQGNITFSGIFGSDFDGVFNNLKPNTAYNIYVRYIGDETYRASNWSTAKTVTTNRAVRTNIPDVSNVEELLSVVSDTKIRFVTKVSDGILEYSMSTEEDKVWASEFSNLSYNTEYKVYVRYAMDDTYFEGDYTSFKVSTIKNTPSAPSIVPVVRVITKNSVTFVNMNTSQVKYQYYAVEGSVTSAEFDEDLWQDDYTVSGLKEDTTYTFFMRTKEDDLHFASASSNGTVCTTTPMKMEGVVTIDSDITFNDNQVYTYNSKLTVNMSQLLVQPESPTYQWYYIDTNTSEKIKLGSNSALNSTYYVSESDIGKEICVTVDGGLTCPGSVTSASVLITKGYVTLDASTTSCTVNGNTITINSVAGTECSIDGKNYHAITDSYQFTSLTPNADYTVYVRIIETNLTFASEPLTYLMTTTKKNQEKPNIAVTHETSSFTLINIEKGCTYIVSGDRLAELTITYEDSTNGEYTVNNLIPNGVYNIIAYRNETAESNQSESNTLTFRLNKLSQDAPSIAPKLVYSTANVICIEEIARYQYSIDGGIKWQASGTFTGLTAVTEYEILYRYIEDTFYKASDYKSVYFTTDKESPIAPQAITANVIEDTKIEVTVTDNLDYYIFEGEFNAITDTLIEENWRSGKTFNGVFKGLKPNTVYSLLVRYAETETSYQSEPSNSTVVTTKVQYVLTYNVTYLDDFGEETTDTTYVTYYSGQKYVKANDPIKYGNRYTYTFTEWDNEITDTYVYNNAEFNTVLTCTLKEYKVIFEDYDGTQQENFTIYDIYYYNDSFNIIDALEREEDEFYTYTFKCWKEYTLVDGKWEATGNSYSYVGRITDLPTTVTGNVKYVAEYNKIKKGYTITFIYFSENGEVVNDEVIVAAGGIIEEEYPNIPIIYHDETKHHVFINWDCYDKEDNKYKIATEDVSIVALYESFEHYFDDWNDSNIVTLPTNEVEGLAERYCDGDCGFKETLTLPVLLDGSFWTYSIITNADCENDGIGRYTAIDYEGLYVDITIKALEHEYEEPIWNWSSDYSTATITFVCSRGDKTESIDAVITFETTPATCSDGGLTIYTATATFLGKEYTDVQEQVLNPLGHKYIANCEWNSYDNALFTLTCENNNEHVLEFTTDTGLIVTSEVTKQPTCVEQGERKYTATVVYDGITYTCFTTESIQEIGHKFTVYASDRNSTCEQDGTKTAKCDHKGCTETHTIVDEGSKLNHSYRELTNDDCVWAEDYSSCTMTFHCKRDGCEHTETLDAEITESILSAPTCTNSGSKKYTATVTFNGKVYQKTKIVILQALNHDYRFSRWIWEEDYSSAKAEFICANVETHIKTFSAVITSEVTDEPNCNKTGIKVYTATLNFEGEEYTDVQEEVLNVTSVHDYDEPVWEWQGYNIATATFICKVNNEHIYVANATITSKVTLLPGCSTTGEKEYTAKVIFGGKEYTSTKVETLANTNIHNYTEPSWNWTGYTGAILSLACDCGDIHYENANITSVQVDPTCEDTGLVTYTAKVIYNGKEYTDTKLQVLEPLEHNYVFSRFVWTDFTAIAEFICANDNSHIHTETAEITMQETIHPTCLEQGENTYYASVIYNGETYTDSITEPIECIGHSYELASWSWAEEYDVVTAKFICLNDNTHIEEVYALIESNIEYAPNCTETGIERYTATVLFEGALYTDTKDKVLPIEVDTHVYSEPVWIWSYNDVTGYSAIAKFICIKNVAHYDEVDAIITDAVTKEPNCAEEGIKTFTATVTFDGVVYTDTTTEQIPTTNVHIYGEPTWEWTGFDSCTARFVCTIDDSHTFYINADSITDEITVEPTCSNAGIKVYTATVNFEGKDYCTTTEEVLSINSVHKYGKPIWTWDGYDSATVTFTCELNNEHFETLQANISTSIITEATCTKKGEIKYIATAIFEGKEYTDEKLVCVHALGHRYDDDADDTCNFCDYHKIDITSTYDNGILSVNLSNEDISNGVDLKSIFETADIDDASLMITIGNNKVTFNKDAIDCIMNSYDLPVFNFERVTNKTIPNAELQLEISLNGIDFSNGKVTISCQFTNLAPEGKVAKVYYVNGNVKEFIDAMFVNGKVTFTTNHFSTYIVVYEDEAVSPTSQLGVGLIIAIVAIILIAGGVIAFILYRRKHPDFTIGTLVFNIKSFFKKIFAKKEKTNNVEVIEDDKSKIDAKVEQNTTINETIAKEPVEEKENNTKVDDTETVDKEVTKSQKIVDNILSNEKDQSIKLDVVKPKKTTTRKKALTSGTKTTTSKTSTKETEKSDENKSE